MFISLRLVCCPVAAEPLVQLNLNDGNRTNLFLFFRYFNNNKIFQTYKQRYRSCRFRYIIILYNNIRRPSKYPMISASFLHIWFHTKIAPGRRSVTQSILKKSIMATPLSQKVSKVLWKIYFPQGGFSFGHQAWWYVLSGVILWSTHRSYYGTLAA